MHRPLSPALARWNPQHLRELAAAIEGQRNAARRELDEQGRDELATILLSGSRETIGFWRRARERMAEEAA